MMRKLYVVGILAAVFYLFFAQEISASSFKDALKLLKIDLKFHKKSYDLKNFLREDSKYFDKDGNEFFRFQKHINGTPLYGESKLVIFPKNKTLEKDLKALRTFSKAELILITVYSGYQPDPQLNLDEAIAIATKYLKDNKQWNPNPLPASLKRPGTLVLYRFAGLYRLVYAITLPAIKEGLQCHADFFVDAKNGEIVDRIFNLYDLTGKGYDLSDDEVKTFPVEKDSKDLFQLKDVARKLHVYVSSTRTYSTDADNFWKRSGPTRKENQKAEVEAYLNMANTIDYYKNNHAFTWNGQVTVVAHYGTNYNNAFFSPWQGGFFFGDGSGDANGFDYLTKGLDVIAHEFTHGVINANGGLKYSGEPGALNEHIADFFGACVDGDDWMMGDDIATGDNPPLRNMQDPTRGMGHLLTEGITYKQWRTLAATNGFKGRIYPDRVSRRIVCTSGEDNGGVHLNCSIFNKFCYLVADGTELESMGLGREIVSKIYMRLLKDKYLSYSATWNEFKDKFLAASAIELKDLENEMEYMKTVKKAFQYIGLQ
ncbi:M4 family metallopeptidase [Candidatus Riflebacteria bacterium]